MIVRHSVIIINRLNAKFPTVVTCTRFRQISVFCSHGNREDLKYVPFVNCHGEAQVSCCGVGVKEFLSDSHLVGTLLLV